MISGKHFIIDQNFFWILGKMSKDLAPAHDLALHFFIDFFNQDLTVSFWFSDIFAHPSILSQFSVQQVLLFLLHVY